MPKASRRHIPGYMFTNDAAAAADDTNTPVLCTADPAQVAAARLVEAALRSASVTAAQVGRCVCVVILPDNVWSKLVCREWGCLVFPGNPVPAGWRDDWETEGWRAWAPGDPPSKSSQREETERFAKAVAAGLHCAGFSTDAAWLPPDMVQAADLRLTLPRLSPDDVGLLAGLLCGGLPAGRLDPAEAVRLTPRLLRLARRVGQDADAYVDKLRDLLSREDAVTTTSELAVVVDSPRAAPTLDRLHGMEEAVAWGEAVARDLRAFQQGSLPWSAVDRGCLLSGPPGCGKTLFAQGLAATCGVPLICGSYGEWLGTGQGHQGDLLNAMRKSFAKARTQVPSILFVDEIDSFPNRATITHHHADWVIQVVNALLAEIDGASSGQGVILVGACNHPNKLDSALVRSGRLDRHIRIRLPGRNALAAILREHLGADLAGQDLAGAALAACGATGADCERFVRGARRRGRAAGREVVPADLLDEIGGSDDRSPGDIRIAAVHEAGHAVAACALRPGWLEMVTIDGIGEEGGRTRLNRIGPAFGVPADISAQLVMVLAGRAAEHETFGAPSSGSGGGPTCDLALATELAVRADTALGFDEVGGLSWRGLPDTVGLPGMLAADQALAGRVRTRLEVAYAEARNLMRVWLSAVHALADALATRRVLDGVEADAIIQKAATRLKRSR